MSELSNHKPNKPTKRPVPCYPQRVMLVEFDLSNFPDYKCNRKRAEVERAIADGKPVMYRAFDNGKGYHDLQLLDSSQMSFYRISYVGVDKYSGKPEISVDVITWESDDNIYGTAYKILSGA